MADNRNLRISPIRHDCENITPDTDATGHTGPHNALVAEPTMVPGPPGHLLQGPSTPAILSGTAHGSQRESSPASLGRPPTPGGLHSFRGSWQINFGGLVKEADIPKDDPTPEPLDVFSVIESSNNGSERPIIEGDIAVKIGRSAIKCDNDTCRWNKDRNGAVNVPFVISADFSAQELDVITTAMQDFATLTCVRFVPRSSEADYLMIIPDSGCWSYVGKMGGPQEVSLSKDSCITKGIAQHELNHALGFFHEHSRSDRDNYIHINKNNIIVGLADNFDKYNTNNLGLEYDYSSVMHYGRFAFSISQNLATIVPKPNSSVAIGQRYGLSNLDISKINKLYTCDACSTLLPDSTGSFVSANYPNNYHNNAKCFWLIRVPSDQVFLQFSAFDVQGSPSCSSDYLKVYDGANTSSPVLLDRACGTGQVPSLLSSGNMMLLEFASDSSITATGFKGSYSTVKCGSTLTSYSGVFSSPNYPSSYPALAQCTWVIIAPVGFKVSLNMTYFYLEIQRSCFNDYLVFYDGPTPTSPQIGKYCSMAKVPTITSTKNSLVIQFVSDESVQTRGFLAKYAFVPQN
ncbi:embryonic protein UVS.2-like [Pelobates fuscus]|uniref:embryonic protein UVS.2-like n=1 Tax=Pelobates fuscus TaxID=191477 RepID=UPI002FE47D7F